LLQIESIKVDDIRSDGPVSRGWMMSITRRGFLKATGIGTTIALGFDVSEAQAEMRELKIARTTETRSTCPYCAVSCGVIIHTIGDKAKNVTPAVVHVEGDPDHPINRGTLCPKGATLRDDINNPNRLLKPKVRRPGSDHWEDISWDDAIAGIARHIKDTRDRCFVARNAKGQVVNRNPGMAMIGGCTDTNEFNYLQWKVITALGVPYRDSQARV
jgi:formate dehydrogenase major subunit